jgi:hypothetical protein
MNRIAQLQDSPEDNEFRFTIETERYTYGLTQTDGQYANPIRQRADHFHLEVRITQASTGLDRVLFLHSVARHHLDTDAFVKEKLLSALQVSRFGEIPKDFDRSPDEPGVRFCRWC